MEEFNDTKIDRLMKAYSPSWYDRFSDWVDRRKLPSWLLYLSFPILWILLGILLQQLEGSGTIRDWDPISLVAISQIGYILFINQFLDKRALKALEDFKPALNLEAEMYPRLQRLISTLPARRTLVVTILFGMLGVLMVLAAVSAVELYSPVTVDRGPFGIVIALTMLMLWASNELFVYHTFHQLSVVNYIYTQLTTVHPFHQRELFAFSGFSAQTGIAFVIITPLWIVFDPGVTSLVISTVFALFGFIAFLSPLIGVHNILAKEKDRLVDENATQLEKTIDRLMMELKRDDPEGLELFDRSLTTLKKAQEQIEAISTWPWKIETLRKVIAAIFLPLIIWLLQYFLAQALTG
jgi:hypothetical protein